MHCLLVHHVGSEPHRLSAERSRVDEASRRAQLRVLHVVVKELEAVHRAELDLCWQRVTPIRLSRVESSTQIPYRGAKCQRRPRLDIVLRSEVDRPRALNRCANAAALTRAIHAQLNQLVVESCCQTLRNGSGVGRGKHHIAWENHADHLAQVVGDLLLANVQDVDGDRCRSPRANWRDESERVTDSGNCR